MEIERYREFIALASELNYHRAAAKAFVTQSSLSKHIAALERHYGTRLFERDRLGVRLTGDGEALLEYAIRIWNDYEESVALFNREERHGSQALVVGGVLDDPTDYSVVTRVVELLSQREETVVPRFLNCSSPFPEVQAQALRSGEVDVAVLQMNEGLLGELPGHADFEYRHVFDAPIVAVVSENHVLASRGTIGVEDLQGCRLVHAVGLRLTMGWRLIEQQLSAACVNYTEKLVNASTALDFMNADPGDALFLLGKAHARARPASVGQNRTALLRVEGLSLPYGAFYLKERASRDIDAFLEALAQSFAELNG